MAAARPPGERQLRGQEGGMNQRAMSLRMPEPMATQLAAIARTVGVPISEFVRQAIENHMALTLAEEGFKERMKQRMDEDREVLKDLGIDG